MISLINNRKNDHYKFVVFYGTFIDTPKLGEIRIRVKTSVGVSLFGVDNGCIKFIKENSIDPLLDAKSYDGSLSELDIAVVDSSQHVNSSTTFFFPGFIDTHIHASQYPNAGIFGNSTLLDWLDTYTFPLEASLEDLSVAEKVYTKIVQRTLSHGTTTATYYTTIDPESTKLMGKICSTHGQRALVGKVCMDVNSPDFYIESAKKCLKSCEDVIEYLQDDLKDSKILPILTPRFAPTCSRDLMVKLSEMSEKFGDLHIQTHLSENDNEIEWVSSLFPECENYTDVYDRYKLLTKKTVLAHCVHLSNDEAQLIKERECGISHCPISNSSITSGECKVRWLLDQGISVGLGTDVSGGYACSILATARQAHLVSRHLAMKENDPKVREHVKLSLADALFLATTGGAQTLDMQNKLGTFDIGKQFDTQLIDIESEGSNVDIFDWQRPAISQETAASITSTTKSAFKKRLPPQISHEDLLAKWFFNGDDRNVVRVWVDGKLSHSI